jgi:pimeloyl-ACP methyl ester carboxylesterase
MKYVPCEFQLPSGLTLRGFSHLPVTEFNSKTNPVVLCLHGWLDNAASFLPLWNSLFALPQTSLSTSSQNGLSTSDEQDLRAYIWHSIDFPGHGLSDHRSPDAAYHHTDYILDIAALIETQDWKNVILVGHSMGGIVGASVCALLPDRIKHFVSIEALGPLVEEATVTVQQMRKALRSRIEQAQKTIKQPDSLPSVINAKMKVGKVSEEHAKMIMLRNLREDQGNYLWGTDPKLRTISTFRMTSDQAKDIMRQIRCPILFIKGDVGFVRIAEQFSKRSDWLTSKYELLTLSGNHYVHMQAPRDLLTAIYGFLKN